MPLPVKKEWAARSAGYDMPILLDQRLTSATSKFSTLRRRSSMRCGCGETLQAL